MSSKHTILLNVIGFIGTVASHLDHFAANVSADNEIDNEKNNSELKLLTN